MMKFRFRWLLVALVGLLLVPLESSPVQAEGPTSGYGVIGAGSSPTVSSFVMSGASSDTIIAPPCRLRADNVHRASSDITQSTMAGKVVGTCPSNITVSEMWHYAELQEKEADGGWSPIGNYATVRKRGEVSSATARSEATCANNAYGYIVTGYGYIIDHGGNIHWAHNPVKSRHTRYNPCGL